MDSNELIHAITASIRKANPQAFDVNEKGLPILVTPNLKGQISGIKLGHRKIGDSKPVSIGRFSPPEGYEYCLIVY